MGRKPETAVPEIPTFKRKEISKSWETVSKAELKSSSRSIEREPESP